MTEQEEKIKVFEFLDRIAPIQWTANFDKSRFNNFTFPAVSNTDIPCRIQGQGPFICTRPEGHDGLHIAHGGYVVAVEEVEDA